MEAIREQPRGLMGALRAFAVREVGVLAALMGFAVAAWTFLTLAEEVSEGESHAVDRAILYGLRDAGDPTDPLGPHWLEIMATDLTSLGSLAILGLIVFLVAGLFAAMRHFREAAVLLIAPMGGLMISQLLKAFFARERPDALLHVVEAQNMSFPSGHAMLSAVVYLTLAALVSRFATKKRIKAFALGAGVLITVVVGVSRVYLGVHWPSDVLAGWSVGAAWALAWWLGAWLVRRLSPAPT